MRIQTMGTGMTDAASADAAGAVTGGVRTLLRLEGLALFIGMTLLYYIWDGDWWVYAILFFVPDLSFAAYLSGPRFGALIYNAAHSYLAPMAMMRLFAVASTRSRSANAAEYQRNENPSHSVNFDELKLKIASTSNGTCRNA